MNSTFSTFLTNLGLIPQRNLCLASHLGDSQILLCKEVATGRLLVAKRWPRTDQDCAAREANAMAALQTLTFVPDLALCANTEFGSVLIRKFFVGSNLEQTKWSTFSSQAKVKFFSLLKSHIEQLHLAGWAHRDLSPKNILTDGQNIQIIDWDLAEPIQTQEASAFETRGTVGYSLDQVQQVRDFISQDIEALAKISQFLGIDSEAETRANIHSPSTQMRKSWLKQIFSARN